MKEKKLSISQKLQAWLELCDLCYDLMRAGWSATQSLNPSAKTRFRQKWETYLEAHQALKQRVLARLLKHL